MAAVPDLAIIYCGDALDWNKYLSQCFAQVTEPETINIHHERLDRLTFPLTTECTQVITSSKCVLVIISPDFLDYLDEHAEVFELGKLLKPYQTVAILCGIQETDVSRFQKAALVSYDSWPRLVAQDQDENFVLSVIRVTKEILTRMEEVQTVQKPNFQLSPRKVKEGSSKVFLMMKKPINEKQKIQVYLDADGSREVLVKRRNAYTFQFVVPENLLRYSRMMSVQVRCDEGFLGSREIKVESRMGELYSILSSVNSPYELLCETLGVASYHEVDEILTKNFLQNSTEGLPLLAGNQSTDKKKSVDELPTLMHFAARYGLPKLMKAILQYPMAMPASRMKNVRGLTPAQLANSSGHNGIVLLLEEFEKTLESVKKNCRLTETNNFSPKIAKSPVPPHSAMDYQNIAYANEMYDRPLSVVVPVGQNSTENEEQSPDYLPMTGTHPLYADKLEPHQLVILGLDDRPPDWDLHLFQCRQSELMERELDAASPRHYQSGLCSSQKELLDILDNYKKGTPMTDVEKQFHLWQNKHKESSNQNTLSSLREAYKIIQKQQKPNKKQAFSLHELKQMLCKMGKKGTQASLLQPSEKPSKEKSTLPEDSLTSIDSFRPVSTLSTASTASSSSSSSFDRCSAISAGSSTYDSGNHSDSCDETARLKEKMPVEVSRPPIEMKRSISLRPPAPPPRPPKLVPKKKNYKFETKLPGTHNYYNQRDIREYSPDYIVPETDSYVFASEVENVLTNNSSTNSSSTIEEQRREISHLSKQSNKYKSTNSGEDIYYDIPAAPLPVHGSTPKPLLHQDYQFPKLPAQRALPQEKTMHYYAIPKTTKPYNSPRPTLSIVNIPLEVSSGNPSQSPDEDRCSSIPSEPPPPPPIESDYDQLPLPRKYVPSH